MSVNISTAGKGVDPNTVDTYDSGDDWEIGVGNLIIDLDADLEKDRQKFEMNNSTTTTTSSSNPKDCGGLASGGAGATAALADGLKFASVQPSAPQGNAHKEAGKSKVKRSKTSKDANKSLPSAALYGIPEISGTGKRQEVQGRPGEATGMNSALGQSVSGGGGGGGCNPNSNGTGPGPSAVTAGAASCGKGKEEKAGKSQSSRGAKRDKDAGKSRKDKHDLLQGHQNGSGGQAPAGGHLYGFGAKSNGGGASPFNCGGAGSGGGAAAGEVSKSAPDSGLVGNCVLVKKEEEEEENHRRIKKLKTEKVG